MDLRTIAFVGNCQAYTLSWIYQSEIAPAYGQTVLFGVEPGGSEEELERLLAADAIVMQILEVEPKFYRRIPSAMRKVPFSTVSGRFLYPFGGQAHPNNPPHGPFDQERGDSFLNRMIRRGVSPEEALDRYLHMDIAREANLDRLYELHTEQQRKRDQKSGINIGQLIEERFRTQKLFNSPGHAINLVFEHQARAIFSRLGVPEAEIERALSVQLPYWMESSVPVHPGVIRHFGLEFLTEESRWPIADEGQFTFAEWVIRYMNLEWSPELREGRRLAPIDAARALPMLEQGLARAPRSSTGLGYKAGVLSHLGRVEEAVAVANEALTLEPDNLEILLRACECRFAAGDVAGAEALAQRACTLFPNQAYPQVTWATVCSGADREQEIRDRVALAMRLQPYNARIHVSAGHCLLKIGDLAGAERAFRAATKLDGSSPDTRALLADVLLQQGRRDEALALLRDLVAENTRNPRIYARLGNLLLHAGDLAAAEQVFRTGMDLDRGLPNVRRGLADVLNRQGRHEEALALLRELVAEGTDDPHLHARLGHVLTQAGDLAGAEAAFRTASELEPTFQPFRIALANVLSRQGQKQAALVLLHDVVVEGTRDAQVHAWLGEALVHVGDLAGAEQAFREATKLAPERLGFRSLLGEVLWRQGRRNEALALVRQLVSEGTEDPHDFSRIGQMLAQSGELAGAETAFRKAVELAPRVQGFRLALVDVLNRRGNRDEALSLMREVAAEGTTDPQVYSWMGHALARSGDLTGAEAAFRRAGEIDPKSQEFRSLLAEVLNRQGRGDEALALLRQLVSEGTDDAQTYFRLGHVLGQAGDLAGAVTAFTRAAELAPSVPEFRRVLAEVLSRAGRKDDALALLQQLANDGHGDAHLHARIGHLLTTDGDFAGAAAAFRAAIAIDPSVTGVHNALADALKQQEQHEQRDQAKAEAASAGPVEPAAEQPSVAPTNGAAAPQDVSGPAPTAPQAAVPPQPEPRFFRSMVGSLLSRRRDQPARR